MAETTEGRASRSIFDVLFHFIENLIFRYSFRTIELCSFALGFFALRELFPVFSSFFFLKGSGERREREREKENTNFFSLLQSCFSKKKGRRIGRQPDLIILSREGGETDGDQRLVARRAAATSATTRRRRTIVDVASSTIAAAAIVGISFVLVVVIVVIASVGEFVVSSRSLAPGHSASEIRASRSPVHVAALFTFITSVSTP